MGAILPVKTFGYVIPLALCLGAAPVWAQTSPCDDLPDMVAISACVAKEYALADAALNAAYQAAMADMKAIDAGLPLADRGAAEALKTAQRAWITMRDATCTAEGYQWWGGSGQGLAVQYCLLTETTARSQVLQTLADYE